MLSTDVAVRPPVHRYHYEQGIPTSWYCVAWSEQVRGDTTLNLRYFGADLICFRTSSGEARVSDAHSPRLGDDLERGHQADGQLRCRFHGLRRNSAGENTAISCTGETSRCALAPWLVHEVNGMIFVWYDSAGSKPTWRIPAYHQCASNDYLCYYPDYCRVWPSVSVHPQQAVENVADPAHVRFVHHSAEVPEVARSGADGPLFATELRYTWGGGKPSTWLTPDGPIDGASHMDCWGLGFIATTYEGIHPTMQLTAVTPIDAQGKASDFFSALIGAKGSMGRLSGPEFATRLSCHFFEQVEADMPIWSRQTLIEHPPYPKLEARAYHDLREWAATFYPGKE